jgi:CTP synthase
VISIHLTLIPYLKAAKELKTKPTQHSVKQLLEAGIQPDILVCRSEYPLPIDIRKKIALFCNVQLSDVIEALDAETIYDVPILMSKEKLAERALQKLKLKSGTEPDLKDWKDFLGRHKNPTSEVNVALVGKYVELPDAYMSIAESFVHAGAENECRVKINYIHAESITKKKCKHLFKDLDGILVAPGFGERGINGKIEAVRNLSWHAMRGSRVCSKCYENI